MDCGGENKKCVGCGLLLPALSFYKKTATRFDTYCKDCRRGKRCAHHKQEVEPVVAQIEAPDRESGVPEISDALFANPDAPYPRLPQYTCGEVQKAVEFFKLLVQWRDEARQKGLSY